MECGMATTTFFEESICDKERKGETINLEFGRSSYYYGESLIYLRVNGQSVILDEATGRRLCEAMGSLGRYLSYEA
jgi:hypothetical protein